MVSAKDILIKIAIGIYWFISSILLAMLVHPALIVPNLILVIILDIYLERKKNITAYVKDDFLKLGYEITSERPLRFSEFNTKFEISFEPQINDIPISRYKYLKRFTRIFYATNRQGEAVMLNSVITRKWNGENEIEIKNLKSI